MGLSNGCTWVSFWFLSQRGHCSFGHNSSYACRLINCDITDGGLNNIYMTSSSHFRHYSLRNKIPFKISFQCSLKLILIKKFYGTFSRVPWNFLNNIWTTPVVPLNSMELKQQNFKVHGIPWISMEFFPNQNFHGIPWNFFHTPEFHGIPWNFSFPSKKKFHGIPWN